MLSLYKYDELYQWDTGRALLITPDSDGGTPSQIEFEYNGDAIVESPKKSGTDYIVRIPDLCLQSSGMLIAYEVINLDGHITYNRYSFVIKAKSKPNDYVCEDPDILTWHELDGRLTSVENSIELINSTITDENIQRWNSIGAIYISKSKPPGTTSKDLWLKVII